MASIWAGYRYFLLGFLLLDTFFILIISAQNIQTGRLVGGGSKSNIFTLIVSLFSGIFLAIALWFDLQKRQSKIAEVRWEFIWVATIILFNIIGFASIASNKPAPNTCNGPNSAWNICAASQGLLALLALSIIALIAHASALIVLVVKLSRRTEYSVWAYMAWGLVDAVDPPQPIVTTTNVPLSLDGMTNVDLGRPVSKALPIIPPDEPSPMSWRRRDPFTFSSVSSLLNPVPRELPRTADGRFQLYDAPVPVPVDRPPVQRAFERVSGYMGDAPSFSLYYAPTPVYDKFARGKTPGDSPTEPVPPTPKPMPSPPKKIQKRDGKWMLADEEEAIERRALGEDSVLPLRYASLQQPPEAHTAPIRRPTRTPPRVAPGSLPNPNMHRPNRIP